MEMTFTLTVDDLMEMHNEVKRRTSFFVQWKPLLAPFTIAGTISLAVGYFVFGDNLVLGLETLIMIVLLTAGFIWWGLRNFKAWQLSQCQKQLESPSLKGQVTVSLSDLGFGWRTALTESEVDWSSLVSFLETDNLFLIRHRDSRFNILPKRASGSEASLNDLRSLLTSKVGYVFPEQRK